MYQYFYLYDYGDNSSSDDVSEFNSTHLFERPGNYSYAVEGFAVDSNDHSRAYYGLHKGMVVILGETSVCVCVCVCALLQVMPPIFVYINFTTKYENV